MDAFQAVCDTIRDEFDFQQLPPFLDETIELFSKAHIYYRTFKQEQYFDRAAQNPEQGHPAVYGAALHLVGDYTSMGAYAVNVALVTKCTEDLLNEYRQLSEDYQKFYHSLKWQYPLYQPVEWKRGTKERQTLLASSFYLLWQVQVMGFVRQILKITRCAMQVLWQSFKLSMCLCDAYLLLNGDPQARYEACTELVAEWDKYQNQLKVDQKRLLEEIEKGCKLADRILHHIEATKSSSFIINNLKQKIEKLGENAEELLDNLYAVGEETVDTFLVKGKITPLHINLTEGKAALPALPRGRFPPWAGQKVELIVPPSSDLPLESMEDFILQSIQLPYADGVKGVAFLASRLHQFYKNHAEAINSYSPFA